jgi:hypothetical protein
MIARAAVAHARKLRASDPEQARRILDSALTNRDVAGDSDATDMIKKELSDLRR